MGFEITNLFRSNLPAPAAASFSGRPKYNFIGGHNDSKGIPVADLAAAAVRTLEVEGEILATYGLQSGPQGHRPLREFVADRLTARAGMRDSADEVLITTGSMEALDLIISLFLGPGDAVIAEEATFGVVLARLAGIDVTCRGARQDSHGIDIAHLSQLLAEQKAAGNQAKFIYTIPTLHNPTGTVMPIDRRRQLLALAEQHNCAIIEDDCYAELLWEGERPPAIRSLDAAGRVIYCGSFSKSIAPALRVGYLVANWPVLAQILPLKAESGGLEQMVLADYCKHHFNSHMDQLTKTLRSKCDVMVSALEEQFGAAAEFTKPKGGMFIWITLPKEVDTTRLASIAIQQGVALDPGANWTVDGEENRHRMRLCFAHPTAQIIREGIAKLADVCYQEFGIPQRGSNIQRRS